MDPVIVITALGDNFAYLYRCGGRTAFAIDPSDASAVRRALVEQSLELEAILVTHAHYDHTAGIAELKRKTACKVVGPDKTITGIDKLIADGDTFTLGNVHITVLATPGHTKTSVCYYVESDSRRDVFTGDTMFVAGCGRILGGDARTMWQSLQKIAALPDDTRLFPGHDYTVEDYEFALEIEPDNEKVRQRLHEVKTSEYTIPSTIAIEKQTSIFLRANQPAVKSALNMPQATDIEAFAELRRRKDVF
jgi:hydroxyacylglutathione hydrolase